MFVIPAIDIRGGKCVRLIQGDPDRQTVYNDDPLSQARVFCDAGADLIHVVDLDGAFEGKPVNHHVIKKIVSETGIRVEVGGGIRSVDAVRRYMDMGIERVIMGTALLENPEEIAHSDVAAAIVVGVDAREGMVATHGWQSVSRKPALDLIKDLQKLGLNEIIYTDISTDGMLAGPNISGLSKILDDCAGIALIASGGVSCLEDVKKLLEFKKQGLRGCIVGKAIYDGRIDVQEALSLA